MAARVVPALVEAEVRSSWWGLRPVTPDDRPVVDRARDGLYVATGHGALGVILGSGTARLVAADVLGLEAPFDPTPFRVERFPTAGWDG
jgi:D-amino-acid dehydrogenase